MLRFEAAWPNTLLDASLMAETPTVLNEAENRAHFVIPWRAEMERSFASFLCAFAPWREINLIFSSRKGAKAQRSEVNSGLPAFAGVTE
jgi:hypothetical protein